MKLILGIDPGVSGGAATLSTDLQIVEYMAFNKSTPADICTWIETFHIASCYIEAVNSMPGQGVASTFKFGMNFGWWQGVVCALKIPHQRVFPLRWQTYMNCKTKGNKNVTKSRAQELFPGIKMTHAIADALLIAEYGRRLMLRENDL